MIQAHYAQVTFDQRSRRMLRIAQLSVPSFCASGAPCLGRRSSRWRWSLLSRSRGYCNGSPAKDVLDLTICFVVVRGLRGVRSSLSLGDAIGARSMRTCTWVLRLNCIELVMTLHDAVSRDCLLAFPVARLRWTSSGFRWSCGDAGFADAWRCLWLSKAVSRWRYEANQTLPSSRALM